MSTTNRVTHPGTTTATNPNIRIVRANERQSWPGSDVRSRQSFPATGSFPLEENAFGLLLIHNDDVVSPGAGFDMHQHDNIEIVTWVVDGALRHRDSQGTDTIIKSGQAQAITAGSGVRHAEVNASGFTGRDKLRVVQMWIMPDQADAPPRHAEGDFNAAFVGGDWVTIATGENTKNGSVGSSSADRQTLGSETAEPLVIGSGGATLFGARPTAGQSLIVPDAPWVHLFVVSGEIKQSDAGTLSEGDVLRIRNAGELTITATAEAEVLMWVMDHDIPGV